MSLYTLIIVTFIIFMAINVIIGLRGRKHASTTKEFLTASGQSGIWFVIASAVGASIGSGVVIGTTQYAVKLGVAGAWYAIACGLACIVFALIMSRFVYRNKLVSFSDYFKRRYDSNFIVLLYSGIGPFACAASMGGQLVAAKAIFQAFGIDPTIGLVITAAVMLVYTMFAGLWGSYATAVFQVGVIIVGVLVVGISMFTQGGIAEIHAFYPAEKFDLFNISPELWMMFVGPMVLSVLVDQTSVQRAASAKTEATAFWGHLLSCIPLFLFGWLMVYIGMWSGAEFPDAGGNAFIVMLMNKVSPIVCAVMICAILAAIMSTASGALVATDALVVHDLYCGFINKNATEAQQKRLNLIVNIVFGGSRCMRACVHKCYRSSFGRLYHYALRYAGPAAWRHHLEARHDEGRGSFRGCRYDYGAAEHFRRDYRSVLQHFPRTSCHSSIHCGKPLHQTRADGEHRKSGRSCRGFCQRKEQ